MLSLPFPQRGPNNVSIQLKKSPDSINLKKNFFPKRTCSWLAGNFSRPQKRRFRQIDQTQLGFPLRTKNLRVLRHPEQSPPGYNPRSGVVIGSSGCVQRIERE